MFIAICDDDILYMNKVKEMIEQWGKDNNEDVQFIFLIMGML